MKFKPFIITLILFIAIHCNGMTENQVHFFTNKYVYSRSKVIELFQISALTLRDRCSNNIDALNYMINEGIADQFSRSFYEKNSVDVCLILFLSLDCSVATDNSTQISYYANVLYHCKLKPVELFH